MRTIFYSTLFLMLILALGALALASATFSLVPASSCRGVLDVTCWWTKAR